MSGLVEVLRRGARRALIAILRVYIEVIGRRRRGTEMCLSDEGSIPIGTTWATHCDDDTYMVFAIVLDAKLHEVG